MEFEWDSGKSDRNLRDRGFDFAFAALIFQGRTIEHVDDRSSYGEVRTKAIGHTDGEVYVVSYTDRAPVRRIISARLANRKERAAWHLSA